MSDTPIATKLGVKPALEAHRLQLGEKAVVWVSYPKGRPKDEINRDSIWERAREVGFEAVSQVSVDERWSALRLKRAG